MIRPYFQEVEELLSTCPLALDFHFDFTVVDFDRGFWKGRITFRGGFELHLFEYVIVREDQINVQTYRYHFQDSETNLVFRYDNAPHHPNVATHPHHIHTADDLQEAQKPKLSEVLDEVLRILRHEESG